MIIVPGSSNLIGVEFAGAKFISSSVSDATRYRRIGRRVLLAVCTSDGRTAGDRDGWGTAASGGAYALACRSLA
jgi:hypothetical protein